MRVCALSCRAREVKEELEDRLEEDEQAGVANASGTGPSSPIQLAPSYYVDPSGGQATRHTMPLCGAMMWALYGHERGRGHGLCSLW
jgi:hypothetical protein